jgi:ETFB lysine methyltransferase
MSAEWIAGEGFEERAVVVGPRTIRIRRPPDTRRIFAKIDVATALQARVPYWAELWPASISLAKVLLGGGLPVAGRSVLELGSGLGLAGIAAALAGAREVMLSDHYVEALEHGVANAELNGLDDVRALYLDWRRPYVPQRYEVVIGADLLYDVRNAEPVLATIDVALEAGGAAFIADPDRTAAERFAGVAGERGFTVGRTPLPDRGVVYALARRA